MKKYYKTTDRGRCLTECNETEINKTFSPKIGSKFCTKLCPNRTRKKGSDKNGKFIVCGSDNEMYKINLIKEIKINMDKSSISMS